MLCRAFSFVSPEDYPHESGAIFHIDLYMFNIPTEIPNGTKKLNHVKRSSVFQNKPFWIPYGRMNHLHRYWNKLMLTIVLNYLLQLSCLMASSRQWKVCHQRIGHHLHHFFGLGVMNDAAKPDCILPIGDDGSLNVGRSSGELIVIKINTESEYNSNLQIGMALSIK